MFLGFFNNYAAGLSYYYFLANMFTFSQQFVMRKLIDDDALLREIEENKKKPRKKSNFQTGKSCPWTNIFYFNSS